MIDDHHKKSLEEQIAEAEQALHATVGRSLWKRVRADAKFRTLRVRRWLAERFQGMAIFDKFKSGARQVIRKVKDYCLMLKAGGLSFYRRIKSNSHLRHHRAAKERGYRDGRRRRSKIFSIIALQADGRSSVSVNLAFPPSWARIDYDCDTIHADLEILQEDGLIVCHPDEGQWIVSLTSVGKAKAEEPEGLISIRAAVFGVVFLWVLITASLRFFSCCWETAGTIGDTFGGANALFSGLAFAFVIYAVMLQRKELELQRLEVRMSRDELVENRAVAEEQAKVLQLQQGELRRQNELTEYRDLLQLVLAFCNHANEIRAEAWEGNFTGGLPISHHDLLMNRSGPILREAMQRVNEAHQAGRISLPQSIDLMGMIKTLCPWHQMWRKMPPDFSGALSNVDGTRE